MSKRSKLALLGAAGLLFVALPAFAKVPQKPKPKAAPVETAVIENTGSTNTLGYKITVTLMGSLARLTSVESSGNNHDVKLPNVVASNEAPLRNQTQKFFADVNAAMPLSSLPVRHGMRSASFGTATYILYKGQRSPDLTFATDPRAVALKDDINAMTRWLGVGNISRHPIVLHLNSPNDSSTNH